MEIREELSMAALANLFLDKFAQKVLSGKNLIISILHFCFSLGLSPFIRSGVCSFKHNVREVLLKME